jgi:hypothetical protein
VYIPPFKLAQMRKAMEEQGIKPVRVDIYINGVLILGCGSLGLTFVRC